MPATVFRSAACLNLRMNLASMPRIGQTPGRTPSQVTASSPGRDAFRTAVLPEMNSHYYAGVLQQGDKCAPVIRLRTPAQASRYEGLGDNFPIVIPAQAGTRSFLKTTGFRINAGALSENDEGGG